MERVYGVNKHRYDIKHPSSPLTPDYDNDIEIPTSEEMWLYPMSEDGMALPPIAAESLLAFLERSHTPPPPPPPTPPPPPPPPCPATPEHLRLTDAEQEKLDDIKQDPNKYYLLKKYPNQRDLSLLAKMAARLPERYAGLGKMVERKHQIQLDDFLRFKPSPDTEFMLSARQFVLPVPQPTAEYLRGADASSFRLQNGQPMLIILDLNGTLLFRPNKKQSQNFCQRENLAGFLKYIFDTFQVMIWTTARPDNALKMRDGMLNAQQKHQLIDTWDRRYFNLSQKQYNEKTTVYKQLEWVWGNDAIQQRHPFVAYSSRWDQTNTILIDDSTVKATAQPYNHILVPEFSGFDSDNHVQYGSVLEQVAGYLEVIRAQSDVSAYIKANPFKIDETRYFKPLGLPTGPGFEG